MFKGIEPSFYEGDKTCLKGPNPPPRRGQDMFKGTATLRKNVLCWLINSYGSTFIFISNFVLLSVRLYFWSHFHYFLNVDLSFFLCLFYFSVGRYALITKNLRSTYFTIWVGFLTAVENVDGFILILSGHTQLKMVSRDLFKNTSSCLTFRIFN